MKFEKDAIQAGRSNVITAAVIIAALAALHFFFLSKANVPMFFPFAFWTIGGFVALMFGGIGVALLRSGGKWEITIDSVGISWISPNESVDKSFNVLIGDLKRSETRVRRASKGRTTRRYYLITNNGDEIKLSPNSGINLAQVVKEVQGLGVENTTINLRKNRVGK